MSRELKYYYKNKKLINQKRRLKYSLKKGNISSFQYDLGLSKLLIEDNKVDINEDLMNDVFNLLQECNKIELDIVLKYINNLNN